jgi:sulfotransferase
MSIGGVNLRYAADNVAPALNRFHFISGLPRSGSTVLAALLRQNPALHANISSPVAAMVGAMLTEMSAGSEGSVFFDDAQRTAVLRGCFENYYHARADQVVFDTNRAWTTRIDLLAELFPQAKIICCVRPIPWIIDSVERLIRSNRFELSGIFGYERGGTVYSRAEGLMGNNGMIGFALAALKQAMAGPEAHRLLLLPYDTLVGQPAAALAAIYDFIGLPRFEHDFENVTFDASEFDARLGTPGLHAVGRRVARRERETILPPDLWERYEGASLWRAPSFAKFGVSVACEPTPSTRDQSTIDQRIASAPARLSVQRG